jgi:hypothetical protein
MLSVERPSYGVMLGLRLSVTSRYHVSHARYVLNYFLSLPRRFDACFLEERVCLFVSKWSVSQSY